MALQRSINLFILSLYSFGASVSLEQDYFNTPMQLIVTVNSSGADVVTNSNFFLPQLGVEHGQYRLDDKKELTSLNEKLNDLSILIQSRNNTLLLANSSLEKLYPTKRYEASIVIDSVRVSESNPYFKRIKKVLLEYLTDKNLKPVKIVNQDSVKQCRLLKKFKLCSAKKGYLLIRAE